MCWWSKCSIDDIMIGKLNHVAIAVPDLEKAAGVYREALGARV